MEMLQKIRKTADVNKLVILQDKSFQILICNIQSTQEMSVKDDIPQSQDICLVDQTLSKKRLTRSDRFVQPNIRTSQASTVKKTRKSSSDSSYQHYLSDTMLQNDDSSSIRKFTVQKTQNKKMKNRFSHKMNVIRNEQEIEAFRKFRVLGWKDNYYTNLLDWSHNNFICAGYLNDLCLYNMAINQDFQSSLYRKFSIGLNGEYLTALKSSSYQTKIALGYSNGSFKIYDYFKQKSVYNGYHHIQRIGTIQWSSQLILTGSKDQFIRAFDPRTKKPYQLPTQIQKAHTQEVCGVKQRGRFVSSGGNDNKVNIYDIRKSTIFDTYAHTAAVKAMAWIGDKSLVTGGGTADKKIKYWSLTQKVYQEVDTGSQVCSLCWSPGTSELVSCQGFSLNQIIIWNKNGERQFTFHGHTTRVLYSALSPNGEYLATGAGDQCLKIWKLFPGDQKEPTLLKEEIR